MREAEQTIRNIVERQKPFKYHVITVKHSDGLYRHFRCSDPASCNYWFDVIFWPGWVAVTGDIGDLMVSRVPDMMTFIRGSIGSISYFAEKVPRCIPTKEYSPDRAKQVLQEKIDEIKEELDAVVPCNGCDKGYEFNEDLDDLRSERDKFNSAGISSLKWEEAYPEDAAELAELEKQERVKCSECNTEGMVHDIADEEDRFHKESRVETLESLLRRVDSSEVNEGMLFDEWMDIFEGDYEVNFQDYNSNFLWCREALMWFIREHDRMEAERESAENQTKPQEGVQAECPQQEPERSPVPEGGQVNEVGQPV